MLGLMQDWPLLCHRIIDHAAIQHGNREVVTRSIEGPIHRTNYREVRQRALKVAQRLAKDGVKLGDRVATLAWNTWRHLETWYGITGIGAVYHTINPRLFPEQIAYIANHAEDRLMFLDTTFVPLMEKLQDKLPSIQRYVILTDAAHMPQTTLRNAVNYEDWIAEVDGDFTWVAFDENTACGMCYTSGTTGNPKGVVYSHRSNVLHSMVAIKPDYDANDYEKLLDVKAKQGAAPFTVEMKIVDDSEKELPWDGKTVGRLKVKGVAVAKSYFKGEGGQILDPNGFFDTGDICAIDPFGNIQITDRSKDVIKSGGEWISSIDLENLAVGHPKVMEAAVIGISHPKWEESQMMIIIPKKGEN